MNSDSATEPRLRASIEATRLSFGLTGTEVHALVETAARLRLGGVCIPPLHVRAARIAMDALADSWRGDLVTVLNFPTGDRELQSVLVDAEQAVVAGANHLDVVVPGAAVFERDWSGISRFLRGVRQRAEESSDVQVSLKAILETAALDEERIRGAASAAVDAGVRWLKTSTGFHPAGGATEASVRLLRTVAPAEVGVKASGGIRTRAVAAAMLDAGADRIGTSAEQVIAGAGEAASG